MSLQELRLIRSILLAVRGHESTSITMMEDEIDEALVIIEREINERTGQTQS